MKALRLLVLIVILFLAPPVHSSGKLSKQHIISQGKKHSYYLFVPDTINAPAPLLITLHGLGRDGLSLVEKWEGLASREGIILARARRLGVSNLDTFRQWTRVSA